METVLITGGTGMIGTAITKALLEKNYKVIILTRDRARFGASVPNLSYAEWNIDEQTIDVSAVAKADYVIHLAGAGVGDKRWTAKRKREILESRTRSGNLLVKTLAENKNNVRAIISASGIGWYGTASPDGNGTGALPFTEADPAADDFLGSTCKEWEASIDAVTSLGKRLVKFRAGIVLSNKGGALQEFKKPLRFGIATILGNGKQLMSWVHIDDLVRLYIFAVENDKLQGVYNAVAPQIVTNKKFILHLAKAVRGRFFVPVFIPTFVLEIVVGELSIEVLKSAAVSCERIKQEGYAFLYPSVKSAVTQLAKSD